ncbi:hypothetical protein [Streptomyces sp. LaPpAH-108]|uniref:hypothetical protein n=1 Tax=Streptomyces sp. LaPpAH-108 TaxID=1155714 RepID=UPI00037D658B|nr:hypothetical protein [Streptomyces sp. LaPpAH-108]
MGAAWRRLVLTTAVGGIGLSLYAGRLTVDDIRDRAASERAVAEACDHLVSGAQVMDLQGGTVRAESDDHEQYWLDVRQLPSACTVYKVTGSHKSSELFRLIVRSSDDPEAMNTIGDRRAPFSSYDGYRPKADVTAVADIDPEEWPLGDGTLGSYTNFRTAVRAECGPGSGKEAPSLLRVTAVARYGKVSAEDRKRLARIARSAMRQLTHRVGCRTRLPALPDRMPAVPSALSPATAATGSCRWAGRLIKEQGQRRLPDRALATPARDANPVESCLLAVGPDRVRAIAGGLDGDQREYAESALTHSPWWLRTVSYAGSETKSVAVDSFGDEVKIRAGTAGGKDGTWWASSVCDGKPALHTLTTAQPYDDILGRKAVDSLFRAYVDDITTRRGCTHVTYPAVKDFRDL